MELCSCGGLQISSKLWKLPTGVSFKHRLSFSDSDAEVWSPGLSGWCHIPSPHHQPHKTPSLFCLKWPCFRELKCDILVWAFSFKLIRNICNIFDTKADPRLACVLIERLVHFGCEVCEVFTVKSETQLLEAPRGPYCWVTHSWVFESGLLW